MEKKGKKVDDQKEGQMTKESMLVQCQILPTWPQL